MPQQTERAIPTKIESLSKAGVGCKLRLAGRMLSYEPITGLALVLDGEEGILVDVKLCVDRNSNSWGRERLCLVMVVGYLETSPIDLPIPTLPTHAQVPNIDPRSVVRAILVTQCNDLDLNVWNTAIEEGQASIIVQQW